MTGETGSDLKVPKSPVFGNLLRFGGDKRPSRDLALRVLGMFRSS